MTLEECAFRALAAWQIEVYHRGLKQNTGIERGQFRLLDAQKNHIALAIRAFGGLNNLSFDILPSQFRLQLFPSQIAVERIMTKLLAVFRKIRPRIIDLADQQILAIIQTSDGLGCGSHTPKLIGFLPARLPLSFA